ncbi:DedA family protein [Rhodobacter maris]|uniref:Membrane protein DedA with SNARE-associated domain n=1 Tax=Rhodobacter maris TaxID=446682 RepID=A0A285SXK7_9RHOB|nr:DedA family protein [Rhodobacter maris]SOC13011.1 membrane protein DedA with SNARE-associated domain [Rhodobacter maris]
MSLETLISTLGLPGIFLGTMAEGEAVAFFGGVLAHRHFFPIEMVTAVVTAGSITVDNLGFAIGRRAGQRAFVRRELKRGPVRALHGLLERHPLPALLGFRFVYGLKLAGAVLIGTSPVPWRRFALLDALACVIWAHLFCWMGFAAGGAITRIFGQMRLPHHLGLALAGFLLAALGLHLLRQHRKRTRAEESE